MQTNKTQLTLNTTHRSKIERSPTDARLLWQRPQLRRLDAGFANALNTGAVDGGTHGS